MPKPEPQQLALLLDQTSVRAASPQRYQLGDQWIDYTLRRSVRRRSITLTVDEQGLRVGAPWRASQRRIESVLTAHARWIVRKLAEWAARRPAPFAWATGARIMVLGEPVTLAPDPTQPSIARVGDTLHVPAGPDEAAALASAVFDWLRASAQDWFEQRVGHFAPILAVKVPLIRLSNARTRWGTCHPHGRVHLNWRLIQMPPALVDYVVVHELAHLHEPNHSPRFWRRVEAVLPDHAQRRRIVICCLEAFRHHAMLIFNRSVPGRIFMRNFVIALSLAAALSACGTKGPLYLPKDKPTAAPTVAIPGEPDEEKKTPGLRSP
jgi:predicted metal-dependent hydrolase/predicted small lipoprotein YifL